MPLIRRTFLASTSITVPARVHVMRAYLLGGGGGGGGGKNGVSGGNNSGGGSGGGGARLVIASFDTTPGGSLAIVVGAGGAGGAAGAAGANGSDGTSSSLTMGVTIVGYAWGAQGGLGAPVVGSATLPYVAGGGPIAGMYRVPGFRDAATQPPVVFGPGFGGLGAAGDVDGSSSYSRRGYPSASCGNVGLPGADIPTYGYGGGGGAPADWPPSTGGDGGIGADNVTTVAGPGVAGTIGGGGGGGGSGDEGIGGFGGIGGAGGNGFVILEWEA